MEIPTTTATAARDEFMQLLVTQLRHQDPLDPLKQEDFLSQLAQFSSLEQMEKMNTTLEAQVESQQQATQVQYLSQAATLVGHRVDYQVAKADGTKEDRSGTVATVSFDQGKVKFMVGKDSIGWDQIVSVSQRETSSGEGTTPQDNGSNTNGSGTIGGVNSPNGEEPALRRTRGNLIDNSLVVGRR